MTRDVGGARLTLPTLSADLLRWANREGGGHAVIERLGPMPGNAGLSFGFDVVTTRGCTRHVDSYVMRMSPPGVRKQGNTDVLRQVPLLQALETSEVPIAELVWSTDDESWFGTDVIVQRRLDATALAMFVDAGDPMTADQSWPFIESAVGALVAIHALDWQTSLADWQPRRDVVDEIGFWQSLLERSQEPSWHAHGSRLAAALRATAPAAATIGLQHGDFHTQNILYRSDGKIAAVIDWELSSIGATASDLGWLALWLDTTCWHPEHQATMRLGADPQRVREAYETAAGSVVADFDWFRALACFKFASIICFNLKLHRSGKRTDPWYETLASSVDVMFARGLDLLG